MTWMDLTPDQVSEARELLREGRGLKSASLQLGVPEDALRAAIMVRVAFEATCTPARRGSRRHRCSSI